MNEQLFLNQLPTLEHLFCFLSLPECAAFLASSSRLSGHLHETWFLARAVHYNWERACERGLLNVVKYLHANAFESFPRNTALIDNAMANGDIGTARWKSRTKENVQSLFVVVYSRESYCLSHGQQCA